MGHAKTVNMWQCDHCGKQEPWGPDWRSRLILHKSGGPGPWDEELVACSEACATAIGAGRHGAEGMKTCIHCQQSKPLDAFRKSARMIGGRENGCKDCHNERRRARYQADPSATLSRNRKWFQANREKLNAYHREWRNRLDVNRRTAKRREEIAGLADSYVKQLLAGGVLSHSDIPQPLVEAQRELLKIKRYIREHSI